MVRLPIIKNEQKPYRKKDRLLTLGLLLFLFTFSPIAAWAEDIFEQHDQPQPPPSSESSQMDSLEFGLRQSPSLTYKTPNSPPGSQDSLGFFLDKNRQGLGLQWEPGGKVPGIDLGLESHNLYSLNRILPREGPYPSWTPQDDSQYWGNPRTAPDHSGAFLRFHF